MATNVVLSQSAQAALNSIKEHNTKNAAILEKLSTKVNALEEWKNNQTQSSLNGTNVNFDISPEISILDTLMTSLGIGQE